MTDKAPPPVESPKPKDELPDTPSGVYRLVSSMVHDDTQQNKIFTIVAAIIAFVLSLGSVVGGYRLFLNDARAQTKEQVDAGLVQDRQRLDLLESTVKQHLASSSAKDIRDDEDRYRTQVELRELQKVILTREPSKILNEPPRPPAPRDGGP